MMIKLKANDNLAHVREQIISLIPYGSSVIELGCGNGDLLFELSPRVKSGVGFDRSKIQIAQALRRRKAEGISNIDFVCENIDAHFKHGDNYDFSVTSLFLHVIPAGHAVEILMKLKTISSNLIICGFSRPATLSDKLLLWMDQRLSGHYRNFIAYQKRDYMEGIFQKTNLLNITAYDTHIPFVKIFKIG